MFAARPNLRQGSASTRDLGTYTRRLSATLARPDIEARSATHRLRTLYDMEDHAKRGTVTVRVRLSFGLLGVGVDDFTIRPGAKVLIC